MQWQFRPLVQHNLRKRMFTAYVQGWKAISNTVLPSSSSEEAYQNADRLRLELVLNATELNETSMDALNSILLQHNTSPETTCTEHAPGTGTDHATLGFLMTQAEGESTEAAPSGLSLRGARPPQ